MATYRTATATDYQKLLSEQMQQSQSVQNWYNMFVNPLATEMVGSIQATQQQAAYDISSAYSLYKKQQRMASTNPQYATSVKDRVGGDFRRQYAAIRGQENANVGKITQAYSSQIAEQYQSTSKNLASLDAALLEYGNIRFADDTDWYDKMYSKSASGYDLTEYGKQAFDRLLNEVGEDGLNFGGYLRQDSKNAKLADFYESNLGLTRELIAGLSADDMSYTADDVYRAGAQEAYERAKVEAGDRLEEKEFDTFKEREDYYTEQANVYNYQNRKDKDSNLLSNTNYEDIKSENVDGYKDVSKLTLNGTSYYVMNPNTLKESRMGDSRPTVVGSDVLRKLSNEKVADKYQEGDIFKYGGHTFIKQNGKLNVLSKELPETLKIKTTEDASKNAEKIGAGFLVEKGTGWGDGKFTLEDIGAGFLKPFFTGLFGGGW